MRRRLMIIALSALLLLPGCAKGSALTTEASNSVQSQPSETDEISVNLPVDNFDWSTLPSHYHEPENFVIQSAFSGGEWEMISCQWLEMYAVIAVFRSPTETCIVLYEAGADTEGTERILHRLPMDAPIGPIQARDSKIHIGHIILDAGDYHILQESAQEGIVEREGSFYSFAYGVSYLIQGENLLFLNGQEAIVDTAPVGGLIEPIGWSSDGSVFAYWKVTAEGQRQELCAAGAKGTLFLTAPLSDPDSEAYWSDDNFSILVRTAERYTLYSAITGEMMNSASLLPHMNNASIAGLYGPQIILSVSEPDGRLSLQSWDMSWIEAKPLRNDLHGLTGICMTHPGSLFVHDGAAAYLRVERICY